MQTTLAPEYQNTPDGQAAEAILRKCVHCGFCTATCPTYQLLGDELDGPRGRIYLMKQVLEGHTPTRKTQLHLDRCLTCRNCETTCPSGVDYGHLLDIGRKLVDAKVPRPMGERAVRWALKEGIPSPLFGPAMALGQLVRPLMPAALKNKVPAKQDAGTWPTRSHTRKVLMLAGCAQPAMAPNINASTARVLDAVGIQTIVAPDAGCCGAVKFHLNDQDGGKAEMRANIDAWWPQVQQGVEAIVMNASGCGVTVKEYGYILQDDPAYAEKAARISGLTRDLSELLPVIVQSLQAARPALAERIRTQAPKLAFHPPCTLQHGQKLKGGVEQHLGALGFDIRTPLNESHLCCGSAGTYSVLNPALAYQLRDRKLGHLNELQQEVIVSANIGCITHLQSGTATKVRHWVEVLDEALASLS
ncbi:glycolate oxidase subunit GlcF [Candidatus Aalborgicola defluviihabitans]|jgi:glycolate oxidase iron-sulfur subunit|uniref:glycolate oxidase subunit GlcF n=1 Tax=Candidatus Aalborgicola defluviihabitans TaxID=3386187 RepID=UPI001E048456|nr:glycolate oxidase subunit GlcF [Burkholderiales bacterium]MBK6570056.1 glycolate oxidase subunit GlcF [Burkholderiales bacterium]MBK7281791.1 glycolate oxidase subunit GlcF [Burkholderiales bacterium]MBL0242688.1 glycolate oxidase subunit GlcF [Rhodoferax sp.]